MRHKLPLIRLLEGGGGSVAPRAGRRRARDHHGLAERASALPVVRQAMAQAPVVSAALGAVAGLPAARLVASHFALMARETAQVLIAGPALVERARGVKTTKEELGGPRVHLRSGVVDNAADDEPGVFALIRRFLYLPTNVWGQRRSPLRRSRRPRRRGCSARAARTAQELQDAPRDRLVFDDATFFEAGARVRPLADHRPRRLAGQPVGVLANDRTSTPAR